MPAPKGHPYYNIYGQGGRPIKYNQEFIENEAYALYEWIYDKPENIFIERFAFDRGYSCKRVYDWIKVNERFLDVYELFKTKQKNAMFMGAISKKTNYQGCALVLSNGHGIVAKTEQKITGDPLLSLLQDIDGTTADLIHE